MGIVYRKGWRTEDGFIQTGTLLDEYGTECYKGGMKDLMTRSFSKWLSKQTVDSGELRNALNELKNGIFDAALGGHLYKKRIRFKGKGKSGSGRTILCYKKEGRAIFIHGFAKNEKENLSTQELAALKEFSKILVGLSEDQLATAVKNGNFKEIQK